VWRKRETLTGLGDGVDGTEVILRDTGRRGTRDCGSSREKGAGDGVNEGSEVCVILPGLDAPELLSEADDDTAGTAPWKCK
jgi:hypothetical protein